MSFVSFVKCSLRRFGYNVHRFDPQSSELAGLIQILGHHAVDLVLDVGANSGIYASRLFDAGYGGSIMSFEPLEAPWLKLKELSAKNSRWLCAERCAVGATSGYLDMHVAANSTSSSLLPMVSLHNEVAPEAKQVGVEKVAVKPLDHLVQEVLQGYDSIFLKIDVQGFEDQVLAGAKLTVARVVAIQLELSLVTLYEGQNLYEYYLDLMQREGFRLVRIFPGVVDKRTGYLLQMDGVFVRRT